MKKFTGKSLLGELSITRILRKVGLSLMVVLWSLAVFSQESQSTLEVAVQNLSTCYADEAGFYYSPQVTIKDFNRVSKFTLVMEFKETVFDFYGLDWSGAAAGTAALNTSTVTWSKAAHPTDATLSRVTISWGDGINAVTIAPDNTVMNLFKLRFRVDGYPHTYGTNPVPPFTFASDLVWNHDLSKYWNQTGQVVNILTDWTTNGNLTVTQGITDIAFDAPMADCSGGQALVTVTNPASGYYSFNGSSFTANAASLVAAPSTMNTIRYKTTTSSPSCISYYKQFNVTSNPLLSFTVANASINCPNVDGLGDIEVKVSSTNTGKSPYTYYLVPAATWTSTVSVGLAAPGMTNDQAKALLLPYKLFSSYGPVAVVQKPAGTYYVAVQDANECKDLKEAWNTNTWKSVTVNPNLNAWNVVFSNTNVTCCGQNDGRVTFTIAGGTPYKAGYYVWFNGTLLSGKRTSYDSGSILAGTKATSSSSGSAYEVIIRDSLACEYKTTVYLTQPDPIVFAVNHQDASCTLANGKIWVSTAPTGGVGPYEWQITTDPSWATSAYTRTSTTYAYENLPKGVYYARVFDSKGCNAQYYNANYDNAIQVLGIDFNVAVGAIQCYGGTTTATLTILTGDGNHTFKYTKDGGATWVTSPVFAGLTAGDYTFGVKDETLQPNCTNYWTKTITQPNRLDITVMDASMLPPTCPGNADGNLVVKVSDVYNGTPFTSGTSPNIISYYRYKMDNQPWVQNSNYNTFAIDTTRHTIMVEDKNGCRDTVAIDLDNFVNRIQFASKVYNQCKLDKKNLLYPGITDTVKWWGPNLEGSNGYMTEFKWYGVSRYDFQGNVTGFGYKLWTTENRSWTAGNVVGLNQSRKPVLYVSTQYTSAADIATYGTVVGPHIQYGAGTYYLVAKDLYGCYSNTDTIQIIDPLALDIAVNKTNAGCSQAWDGSINITAYNAKKYPEPTIAQGVRYQYVLTQSLAVIEGNNWYTNAPWTSFTNGNYPVNDSLAVINVPKGRYWIAVRDYCAIQHPELIKKYGPIDIEGFDAVGATVSVTPVSCYVYGKDHEATGAIAVTAAGGAGAGTYSYRLEKSGMTTVNNSTGVFSNLYAGVYTLTVFSGAQNCQYTKSVTVGEPAALRLALDSIHVSMYNGYDGLLRYKIQGGNAPYKVTTNNVGTYETVASIPADRWITVSNTTSVTEYIGESSTTWNVVDYRVKAGSYEVYVMDAKGCIYGPVKKIVRQPGKLEATLAKTNVSCATAASTTPVTTLYAGALTDGTITVNMTGGWNAVDGFKYYVRLLNSAGNTLSRTTVDVLEGFPVTFTGLAAGTYKVRIYEWDSSNSYAKPYINYGDYFANWNSLNKWQNPDTTVVYVNDATPYAKREWSITIGSPDPITYAPTVFTGVTCAGTATGKISVTGIVGGVPSTTDGYYVGLEGPCSYTPASGWVSTSNSGSSNTCTTVYWYKTGAGNNSKLFEGLTWGHYTVHIKDSKGCWIYKESGEINDRDPLRLQMQLVENVLCANTTTGKIRIVADYYPLNHPNGNLPTSSFMYAIDTVRTGYGFQLWNDTYVNGLAWQASPDFNVKAGVWVGFVKDGNGCKQGGPSDINGNPILPHRIAVVGPAAVTATFVDEYPSSTKVIDGVQTTCRDASDGKIHISRLLGGNGPKFSAHVWGTSEAGVAVDKWYSDLTGYDQYLTGLPGTYTLGNNYGTATPTYTIEVFDNTGCTSSPTTYKVAVPRPQPFQIALEWDQRGSFICATDKSAIFTINVISGGTPFDASPSAVNKYKYQWEAYKAGVKVDSLSGAKGFVKSFVGYGGYTYKVKAYDLWDCVSQEITVDLPAPSPINMTVADISCYNDASATGKITVLGTPGRFYKIWYRQEDVDNTGTWVLWDGGVSGATVTFTSSITIPGLVFGNTDATLNNRHYDFKVEDNFGCTAQSNNNFFVPVVNPLRITAAVTTAGECSSTIGVTISGGVPVSQLYSEVWIDAVRYTSIQSGWTVSNIAAGTHTLKVVDSHGCEATGSITVVSNPYPQRVINVNVNKGETYNLVDAEAGLNVNIAEGTYTYNYNYLTCPRSLKVTVTGVYPQYSIEAVQGKVATSPYLNKYVSVTGKVTGVKGTEGFWMQDASAAWSGIYVKYSGGGVLEGNGVTVKGKVTEPNSVTTIEADAITLEVLPSLTITAVEVNSAAEAAAEQYESVLVKVKEKTRPSNVSASGWNANGAAGNVAVTTGLYTYTPDASHFYVITGIVQGSTSAFVLTPRKGSDIVDYTQTTNIDPVNGLEFKVYPNPFNDRIFIDNANKLTRAVVCNIAGQRVIDVEYPGREIRTANLVSGVYVVTLFTEDGIVGTERVIKK